MTYEQIAKIMTSNCNYFVGERIVSNKANGISKDLILFGLPLEFPASDNDYTDITIGMIESRLAMHINSNIYIHNIYTPFQLGITIAVFNRVLCIKDKTSEVCKELMTNGSNYKDLQSIQKYLFSLMDEDSIVEHYGESPYPYI